ncbi:P-loop containing nucleoside triphosphate hydrolase protein [Immersiella caudata]|uniref:P-loop containing nucleoside triphosphate hydrolase protein n=1 Tax=Immersiella caudata TaxID=314043 RepID=A0AA39WDN0_9PEZI|nr:P-loop containing nucleoside triphosphate hydrolase protein [Immersiella caudata]
MVNSFVWTAEEAKYLKAVLRWQDAPPNPEEERRLRAAAAAEKEAERNKRQPAGEFRVLVIGARGVGKTSILTRLPQYLTCSQFGTNTFHPSLLPPDPFYERGCRHPIDLDGTPYTIDALEMPSKHLLSNPMLEQALAITEAAILIYDVRDPTTLSLAEGIADFMRETLISPTATSQRDYALLLVGNKSDAPPADRQIPWSAGSKAAAGIRVPSTTSPGGTSTGCAFLEVSAKTGENVEQIFPAVGREILRLKRLGQQRREKEEMLAREARERQAKAQTVGQGARKKMGLWRILFFRRSGEQQQATPVH